MLYFSLSLTLSLLFDFSDAEVNSILSGRREARKAKGERSNAAAFGAPVVKAEEEVVAEEVVAEEVVAEQVSAQEVMTEDPMQVD